MYSIFAPIWLIILIIAFSFALFGALIFLSRHLEILESTANNLHLAKVDKKINR